MELWRRAAPNSRRATTRLIAVATRDTTTPRPTCSIGCGSWQPSNRGPCDQDRRRQDQRALERAREVLGLRVSVRVAMVRRLRREEQQPERRAGGHDVDDRLQRIGQHAHRTGDVPRHKLERDRDDRRGKRQQREASKRSAVHGEPRRARQPMTIGAAGIRRHAGSVQNLLAAPAVVEVRSWVTCPASIPRVNSRTSARNDTSR